MSFAEKEHSFSELRIITTIIKQAYVAFAEQWPQVSELTKIVF